MIKSTINYLNGVERLVRECVAVLIIGIGGAGRVSARTAFRAARTLHGAECPHIGLIEIDLTPKTGRQDTDLVTPNTPGRLLVHIVPPVNAAALVARFADDRSYAPFRAVDPEVIKNLPQTDHLGGCAVPAGARIAIEVNEKDLAELAVKVGQLADLIRVPQPGWHCTGSLLVMVHSSSAGAVGSNDVHVTEMLCRHIGGQHRVISSGLLIAENGRVPNRDESLGLEGTHMSLVRALARRTPRASDPPFANDIDFWTFFRQSRAEERDLYGAAATTTALASKAALEGELQTLETRANRLGDGERCFLCDTRAIHHSPDMLAEFGTGWAIERGALTVTDRSGLRPAAIRAQYASDWQALGSTVDLASRASSRPGPDGADGIVAQVRARLATTIGGSVDLDRAVIAELPSAVQEVRLEDSARSVERRLRALGDEHQTRALQAMAAGRPDEALTIVDVMREYGASRVAEIDGVQRAANDQADAALSDANAGVAGVADPSAQVSGGRWQRVLTAFASWFSGQGMATSTEMNPELGTHLQTYVVAALRSRLVGQLRPILGQLARRADELDARVQEQLAVLRTVASAAADHRRRAEQDADVLRTDISGLVTVADAEIREAAVRSILPDEASDALSSIVMTSVESTRCRSGRVEGPAVFADTRERVGELVDRLRSMTLDALIRVLDDSGMAKVATALQPESSIEFRADQPRPQQTTRYAVPGGADGPLGRWLRVNLRETQPVITDSRDAQLAYAVRVTAPFAIDDLQAYQTIYQNARDEMRQKGREAYLVSDRRHLGLDDGIQTDESMDLEFVRGLVSGAVKSSRGGTFYKMPVGEQRRPADVKPGQLDAIFGRVEKGGGRLGNSVPECRSSLRATTQVRDGLRDQWASYVLGTSPEDRLQQIEALQRSGLPSAELGNALRQLRAKTEEEALRHGRVATARRPASVSGLKSALRNEA